MKITQMKFQKIITKVSVILSAVALLYIIAIFASSLFQFNALKAFNENMLGLALGGNPADYPLISNVDEGWALFEAVQPFNRTMFTLCIVYLFINLSMLAFFCQSRRVYYVTNYVSIGLAAVAGLALSVYALINIFGFRADFVALDIASINAEITSHPQIVSGMSSAELLSASTWAFDIGIVIFVILILVCGALVLNAIWKMMDMKKDKSEFAEIDAQIYAQWEKANQEMEKEAERYESGTDEI